SPLSLSLVHSSSPPYRCSSLFPYTTLFRSGRVATLVMMVISGVVTLNIGTVEGAWKFLLAIGAGTGLVYLLRWYWWRVNAWSEVSAMAAALVFSLVAQLACGLSADDPRVFAYLLLVPTAAP